MSLTHNLDLRQLHFSATAIHSTCSSTLQTSVVVLGISISKIRWSLLHLNCTFTSSLYWFHFRDSDLATWCQASTFLQDLFNPGTSTTAEVSPSPITFTQLLFRDPKPYLTVPRLTCSPWPLHAFKTSTTWETHTWHQVHLLAGGTTMASSRTQLLCVVC